MKILISIKDGFYFMPRISREDYQSLESKIHTEIQKIFSQFMEALENKNRESDETVHTQDQQIPGHPGKSVSKPNPVPVNPRKRSRSKNLTELNKILHGSSSPGKNRPGNILESDMEKILRKKYRKKTQ
jgi:hypothetical protein